MATKKKSVKKKNSAAKKKPVARGRSKAASAKTRKVTSESRAAKLNATNSKSRAKSKGRAGAVTKKNAGRARVSVARNQPKSETVRIFRSPLATRGEVRDVDNVDPETKGLGAESGGQSGSLQGLSEVESADSESVSELLEEGNSFEAEIVKGVQDAPDADESEVHTHQRPQEKDLDEDFREN
jgi:hypothetical protein